MNCDQRLSPCQLTTVSRNSGAAAAGLLPGDIIQKIDGQDIRNFSELTMNVYPHKPGDVLRVIYQRDQTTHEVSLKLGARE